MIKKSDDRSGYIGGSDMPYVYGSFDTPSFRKWWVKKTTDINTRPLKTRDMTIGTILEGPIMDHLGIDPEHRNRKEMKDGTIAGANTDAIVYDTIHEIKTAKPSKIRLLHKGRKFSVNYRRQLYHTFWVTGLRKAKIHFLSVTEKDKLNPFGIDLTNKIHSFDFIYDTSDFDFFYHSLRIEYLSRCMKNFIRPTDAGYKIFEISNE